MSEKKEKKEQQKKLTQAEIQQKAIQLQLLDEQLRQLEQQLQLVDERISKMQLIILHLEELAKTKPLTNMLASFDEAIFINTKLLDNKQVWVDVGKNVVVKKTIPEAQQFIGKKIEELIAVRNEIAKQAEALVNEIEKIDAELRRAAA